MSLSSKQLNIKPDNKKIAINVDDEWSSFISNHYEEDVSDDDVDVDNKENQYVLDKKASIKTVEPKLYNNINAPTPSNIYISTKSKIAYLTEPIDLRIFWDIPIIPYATPKNGVIKKQIKINSKSQEELDDIQSRLQKELYFDEHVMSHIDNPSGRIKFKDIRKITIGISKKDIMSYRSKKKQAFYNCFVMIIRLKIDVDFKEFHIKVFNTGKLEIPGVQNDEMFEMVLKSIIQILQPHSPTQLCYNKTSDTVLINSNFNCGFYIDREMLYDILRSKYNIQAIYDPCSYPGIQCKFYYNKDIGVQTGKQITTENKGKYTNIVEVSFMIFRTGSVLIVGMCEEDVLIEIYNFLKLLLLAEFENVCQGLLDGNHNLLKDKKKKIRKKTITILENECK
jgi:TATA-box binding protein (TBP) (component of TFIID and TFIIIB)